MSNPFIVGFDAATEADHPRIGGKCGSLARMIRAGVRVPPGFAVTTDAYQRHIDANGLAPDLARILRSIDVERVDDEAEKAARIRELIVSAPVPADVEAAIRDACPGVVINHTSGVVGPDYAGALACIRETKPEIAACNAGSLAMPPVA